MRLISDSTDTFTKPPLGPAGCAAAGATAEVVCEASRGLAAAWVFAAGLTGIFLCKIVPINGVDGGSPTAARLQYLAWAISFGGAYAYAAANRCVLRQNPKTRWWITAYAGLFAVMFCRGILNLGTVSRSIYITGLLTFVTPLVLIPCGGLLLRSKPFQATVAFHAACGGLVGLALILIHGLSSRNDYIINPGAVPRGDLGINFESGFPFYALPIALLLLPHLPKLLTVGVLGGAAGWLAFIVTYQSRILSVIAICVPCFLIFGVVRDRRHRRRGDGVFMVGLIVAVLLLFGGLLATISTKSDIMAIGLEALETRWSGQSGSVVVNSLENERYDEADIVLEQMSLLDWAVGRGIGASWSDARIYGGEVRIMVHLGYLDFVFMGGVGLCWLCCVTPLVKAVRGWRTAYGIKFVAISYVLIHSIELVAYGVPQFDPYWLITCVCLGAVLDDGSRRANVAATTVRSGAANITKSFQP